MISELRGIDEAENLLEDLDIQTLPIIPREVSKAISDDNYSILIETKKFPSDDILGIATGNANGALIYINSSIPDEGRATFTEAHELGHVCLHLMNDSTQNSFECGQKHMTNQYETVTKSV